MKTPFKNVERSTNPIELIYSYICDLKFVQTRGGKSILLLLMTAQAIVMCIYIKARIRR